MKQGEGQQSLTSFQLALRLLRQARPFWGRLTLFLGATLLSVPLALLTPLPIKIIVDNFLNHQAPGSKLQTLTSVTGLDLVTVACIFAFGLALLQAMQSLGTWIFQRYIGGSMIMNGRSEALAHVQGLSILQHKMKGSPDLLYRLQNDIQSMEYFVISGVIPVLNTAVTFGTMLAVTLRLDWELAVLAIGVLPVLWLISRVHAARSLVKWQDVKASERASIGVLQETLSCIQVVHAFGQEPAQVEKFRQRARMNLHHYMRAVRTDGAFSFSLAALLALTTAVSIGIGARHVSGGVLSLGNFLILMTYLAQLLKSVDVLSKQTVSSQSALASAARVFELLDETSSLPRAVNPPTMGRSRGQIEFESVNFGYTPEGLALENMSFIVQPGQCVGVVGATGAGKSTLAGLLARSFDPDHGRVLIDGIDARALELRALRAQFAQVLQEPVLFSGTVFENIAYGLPQATPDAVIRAAKQAEAHDFIMSLPGGYQHEVGERGGDLSGGQRQRIAIARAFLLDSPFLILDEPISSVDDETGRSIGRSLQELRKGRTTFLISHRRSFLHDCDLILDVESGTCVARDLHLQAELKSELKETHVSFARQARGGQT